MTHADSLSDDELRVRLARRGLTVDHIQHLLATRDHHATQDDLNRLLGDDQ